MGDAWLALVWMACIGAPVVMWFWRQNEARHAEHRRVAEDVRRLQVELRELQITWRELEAERIRLVNARNALRRSRDDGSAAG